MVYSESHSELLSMLVARIIYYGNQKIMNRNPVKPYQWATANDWKKKRCPMHSFSFEFKAITKPSAWSIGFEFGLCLCEREAGIEIARHGLLFEHWTWLGKGFPYFCQHIVDSSVALSLIWNCVFLCVLSINPLPSSLFTDQYIAIISNAVASHLPFFCAIIQSKRIHFAVAYLPVLTLSTAANVLLMFISDAKGYSHSYYTMTQISWLANFW